MPRRRPHKPGDPTKAVALLRCSTDEQKLSPDAQRRSIAAWAEENGIDIVAERADIGVSGTAPVEKRPGLLAGVQDLRDHGAGVLVVAKRDRLARSVVVAAVAERLVEQAGARVVSADGASDGDGPDAWLMKTIKDAFGQYEVLMIRARTKAALAVVKANGRRLGGVPYGWSVADDDPDHLLPVEMEQKVLRRVRRHRAGGASLRAVATKLNEQGVRTRQGKTWRPEQVRRLLDYAGRPSAGR